MFVYYFTNVYFAKINEIFLKIFVLSGAKNRKIEKGENSDQKVIGPVSQGRGPFQLWTQIAQGDLVEGYLGTKHVK